MYTLSATLKGHAQDIKDLTTISDKRFASVSRDGTARVWTLDNDKVWKDLIINNNEYFLNSVCYDSRDDIIYYSGKDALINGSSIFATLTNNPTYTLIGHKENVCGLNIQNHQLISSSWDKTAKVWSEGVLKYTLVGHKASVWDAKMFPNDPERFITVSADKTVKIWAKDKVIKTLQGIHTDVIRHIEFLNDNGTLFATCSNDGLIKICTLDGEIVQTLEGHESFVYNIKVTADGMIISCGEDRSVRIWDSKGIVKQVIRLPAISIWAVDILPNGDLIVGSSDNLIRVFTQDKTRFASNDEIAELLKEVESSTLNSQTMDLDESKISSYDILQKPGNKEGQTSVVRAPNGVIEAHQFSNGKWTKIGDVVGSSNSGTDRKVEFEGKQYDFVFDVDIEEGKPPLKLPINISDNPYDIAEKFILNHELPTSYMDQIVNFIIKNTSGISLDDNSQNSHLVTANEFDANRLRILPVTEYLSMKSFNTDSIFNGIVSFNNEEGTFNDEELSVIGSALHALENNWEVLYNFACTIRASWKNKIPAYDIIRLIVDHIPASIDIAEFIEEGLGNKNISITMLTVRILVNCFNNCIWGIDLMSSVKVYGSIFEAIDIHFSDATIRQSKALAISVSTLLFNYSVLIVKEDKRRLEIVPVISEAMNNQFAVLEEYITTEEAAYRLLMTYGNLTTVEPTLKQLAKSVSWLNQVKMNYTTQRFSEVYRDLSI